LIRIAPPQLASDFYAYARGEQLDGFPPVELAEAEGVDSSLRIEAPANTRALSEVDPLSITRAQRARAPVQQARLGRRWCGTQWPTAGLAQQAGMSERDYGEFMARALLG
jgi:aminopeptidase